MRLAAGLCPVPLEEITVLRRLHSQINGKDMEGGEETGRE